MYLHNTDLNKVTSACIKLPEDISKDLVQETEDHAMELARCAIVCDLCMYIGNDTDKILYLTGWRL